MGSAGCRVQRPSPDGRRTRRQILLKALFDSRHSLRNGALILQAVLRLVSTGAYINTSELTAAGFESCRDQQTKAASAFIIPTNTQFVSGI